MEIKKAEKVTDTRDYDEEYNSQEEELSEEEEVEEKEEVEVEEDKKQEVEVKPPQCLDWSGWIPQRLIYSAVAGGSFILVLVIAVSISKHVGKKSAAISEDNLCPPGSPVCPKGWFRAFHKCYYLSVEQNSWKASQKKCGSLGANLTIFRSLEEMEFLMKRIGPTYYWLGLTKNKGTSSWTWADGTLPSSWILIQGAGCAHISERGISSDSCRSSRNFMCSKEDSCA